MELLAPKLRDLFFTRGPNGEPVYAPSRYKIAYGGRGSSKSWGFVGVAIQIACQRRFRVLCVREVQSSIRESIHRLIQLRIEHMGLASYFDIQRESIVGPHGSEFIFAGIKSDPGKIQSAADIDVALVEEAQKVTDESWRILIPTIRGEKLEGQPARHTEIWACFNPTLEDDATYQRFVVEKPPGCRRVTINFNDNPWFPDDLELERQGDLQRIANANDEVGRQRLQALYDHVWGGKCLTYPSGSFFSEGSLLVNGKPIADKPPLPFDMVFVTIDTALKTGKEHDGAAAIYWGFTQGQRNPSKLAILDWDLVQIEGALLERWLPGVFARAEKLNAECRSFYGSKGAWIEDKASGIILLQQAANRGWPAQAIDSKLTALGKNERALDVSGYVHGGDVKVTEHAYNKLVSYKGKEKNHLLSQVLGFSAMVDDMGEDDLLDCFTYGIAISLGNPEGF